VDSKQFEQPDKNPYHYCSGNPVNRIDPDGNWDVKVHLFNDRTQHGKGTAIVTDRSGNEVFRFEVRAEGAGGRDRNQSGADTPLGIYDIPDNQAWISGGDRAAYGPNERLNMVGQSGEIITSGRSDIRIHGGRQETYDTQTKTWTSVENPELKKTYGCLRAFDTDMAEFKQIVDDLQTQDSLEMPGEVNILDDLVKVVTPRGTDNFIEVKTEYRLPSENTLPLPTDNLLNNLNIRNNNNNQ
jgi:hypothetical protein